MVEKIEQLKRMVEKSRHLVAFTGAGVSTLSGIPDFRGKNGLYQTVGEEMFSLDLFYSDPSVYYNNARDFIYNLNQKECSIVHQKLAELEAKGKLKAVITQNIDLLHTKAGNKKVFELHGSPSVHRCLKCGATKPFEWIVPIVEKGEVPKCTQCGGTLKPEITFFGEQLPQECFKKAIEEARAADLMLVLGSSLTVQPAASVPLYTLQHGGEIVIVNQQPTPLDQQTSLRFEELEEVFQAL